MHVTQDTSFAINDSIFMLYFYKDMILHYLHIFEPKIQYFLLFCVSQISVRV